MADFEVVVDNTDEIIREIEVRAQAALDACGQQAVNHAKQNIDRASRVDTSKMINSITHKVQDDTCYVGTNVEYAVYHEYGTGKFAEGGKGRKGWWVYVPGSETKGKNSGKVYTREEAAKIVTIMKAKGIDAHMTQGIEPIHFLKNALEDHQDEYKAIIEQQLNK